MTAKTSQHLAEVLFAAGFMELGSRALNDEFHDYLSPHAMPAAVLDSELVGIASNDRCSERERMAAHHIRMRHHDGEFDASVEESDAWAESPEGQAAFAELTKDLNKRTHRK
jgi:GrpB-like predicted nucleotidyltransferase (UPF0157 family)